MKTFGLIWALVIILAACSTAKDPLPLLWEQQLISDTSIADIVGEYENRGELTNACRHKHPNLQFVIRLAQILQFEKYKDANNLVDPTTVKISILNNYHLKIESFDQEDLVTESVVNVIRSNLNQEGWISLKKIVDWDDDQEFTFLDLIGNTHSVESMKVSLSKTKNNELLVKLNLYHAENTLFIPLVSESAECYGLFSSIL